MRLFVIYQARLAINVAPEHGLVLFQTTMPVLDCSFDVNKLYFIFFSDYTYTYRRMLTSIVQMSTFQKNENLTKTRHVFYKKRLQIDRYSYMVDEIEFILV
jgi:hypothetical protein